MAHNKAKTPQAFRRRSEVNNQSRKAKAGKKTLGQPLPWRNPLPHPHLTIQIQRKTKSLTRHFGGEEAKLMQELLVKGGTDTAATSLPNIGRLIRRYKHFHGLRVRILRVRWNGQTITRYWLMEHVTAFVGVRHD